MKPFTIGIDVGTTGTKTVLLHYGQGIVAEASRSATLYSERPGFAEADTRQWWQNIVESIQEILATSRIQAGDVAGIAASGMVPAVVLVDSTGRALRRAILQNDARATTEVERLALVLADTDVVGISGSALTQQSVAPTMEWLRTNEPDTFQDTVHVLGSYDWLLVALGAAPHVERNWALESGLFEIGGQPFSAIFDAAALSPTLIPRIAAAGDQVGALSEEAAAATGLLAGTPLIVGGADHVLSAFGAGVENEGDWLVKLGGAGDILVASDSPRVDPRFYLDAHAIPGRWLPNGCMATSGSLIRWFQALTGGEDLVAMDREAAVRPPADLLCLPYFLGEKSPLHDPNLRGSFHGLHLGHTRADMYRSVLEGIAFGFRHHADIFQETGIPRHRVMVTNGGSKSVLWKQIHADVLGIPMNPVLDHPGASLGAAVIAAIGAGTLSGWSESHRFLKLGEPVIPDPERAAIYDEAYVEWRTLGLVTTPISHSLAQRTHS
jgi:xylulokinase